MTLTPRLATMYVETGLSMPPEKSDTTRPFAPTGMPPAPA
jgi:hypothetical protein